MDVLAFRQSRDCGSFQPNTDYWAKLSDAERRSWLGNADKIVKRVPGLSPEQISNYLIEWTNEQCGAGEPGKAYPNDEFSCCSEWQVVDFMAKLGLDYPDVSNLGDTTYRLNCDPPEAKAFVKD